MRRSGAPTLRAVAVAAGVSVAIVSRVANGRGDGMTAATRARVEAAIEALGYRPNRAARSLRTQRHYRVALLAVDTSPQFLADPLNTYIAAGLANTLSDAGYGLLVQRLDPHAPSDALLERAQEADALTLYLSGTAAERARILRRCWGVGLPVLVFQEPLTGTPEDVCAVRQDDRGGGRWLGGLIRERRRERVLAVVPALPWPAVEERLAGLMEGLGRAPKVLRVDETDPLAVRAALEVHLAQDTPEAVVAINDQLAAEAVRALRRLGRAVPDEVGVTGFNAFPVTGVFDPPLTTVRSPAYRLGTEGGRLVLERLRSGRFPTHELVLPVEPVPGLTL